MITNFALFRFNQEFLATVTWGVINSTRAISPHTESDDALVEEFVKRLKKQYISKGGSEETFLENEKGIINSVRERVELVIQAKEDFNLLEQLVEKLDKKKNVQSMPEFYEV
jgi:hypothetical protein